MKDAGIDHVPSNDFSLYDHVLDTAVMLGAIPARFRSIANPMERYFAMARGLQDPSTQTDVAALEMTKWFDTNYHYPRPRARARTRRSRCDPVALLAEIGEARALASSRRPVLLGPVSFLLLASSRMSRSADHAQLLDSLLPVTSELLRRWLRRHRVDAARRAVPRARISTPETRAAYRRALPRAGALGGQAEHHARDLLRRSGATTCRSSAAAGFEALARGSRAGARAARPSSEADRPRDDALARGRRRPQHLANAISTPRTSLVRRAVEQLGVEPRLARVRRARCLHSPRRSRARDAARRRGARRGSPSPTRSSASCARSRPRRRRCPGGRAGDQARRRRHASASPRVALARRIHEPTAARAARESTNPMLHRAPTVRRRGSRSSTSA